jgi:predicted metal-dependent hydrolase
LVASNKSYVEQGDDCLVVFHRKNVSIKNILNKWYKQQALAYFTKRTTLFVNSYNLPSVTEIKLRNMKARWGSCSSRGELCFNSLLMQKSEVLIDLVIVHELCHLRHFSHNKAFYGLLEKVLPDWRIREKLLDGIPLD